mgnify:CR=1 FL=1
MKEKQEGYGEERHGEGKTSGKSRETSENRQRSRRGELKIGNYLARNGQGDAPQELSALSGRERAGLERSISGRVTLWLKLYLERNPEKTGEVLAALGQAGNREAEKTRGTAKAPEMPEAFDMPDGPEVFDAPGAPKPFDAPDGPEISSGGIGRSGWGDGRVDAVSVPEIHCAEPDRDGGAQRRR